jgi:ankyrin repeat protein
MLCQTDFRPQKQLRRLGCHFGIRRTQNLSKELVLGCVKRPRQVAENIGERKAENRKNRRFTQSEKCRCFTGKRQTSLTQSLRKVWDTGSGQMFENLLSQGANPNVLSARLKPILLEAVQRNDLKTVSILLKHGADIDTRFKKNGCTALHIACHYNLGPMVSKLLKNGADVNKLNHWGRSPLNLAIAASNTEIPKSI